MLAALAFLAAATVGACYFAFAKRRVTVRIIQKRPIERRGESALLYGTGNLPLPRAELFLLQTESADYKVDRDAYRKVEPGMTVQLRQWGDHWRLVSILDKGTVPK